MLRTLLGVVAGTVLGATLYLVAGEVSLGFFFVDFSGIGSLLLFLLALLSWAAAFGIGVLTARIAGRFEIPVAVLSVLIGTSIAQVINEGIVFVSFSTTLIYGVFALFGGAIVYARRQERLRNEQQSASMS